MPVSNKKNILVTGANGQLGMEFRALADKFPQYQFLFVSKEELPVNDSPAIEKYFSDHKITYCINCAAYTAVDKAEAEKEIAFEINGHAVGKLAAICKTHGAILIHFSTDYVFNGEAAEPYRETDPTDPVNAYGASKLLGEEEAIKNDPDSVIIRTSWVYSSYGKNFVKTMLRLMNEKESISVVDDQFGCPTYAHDIAEAVLTVITQNEKPTPGIYNYCNEGKINWFEFAIAIRDLSKSSCKVDPISTEQYPTPAKRPHYSALNTSKIQDTFKLEIPNWKASLESCLSLLMK